jgi:hypothetical protein
MFKNSQKTRLYMVAYESLCFFFVGWDLNPLRSIFQVPYVLVP